MSCFLGAGLLSFLIYVYCQRVHKPSQESAIIHPTTPNHLNYKGNTTPKNEKYTPMEFKVGYRQMEASLFLCRISDKSNKNGNKRFCLRARTVRRVNAAEGAGVMSATRVLFKAFSGAFISMGMFTSEDKRSLLGLSVCFQQFQKLILGAVAGTPPITAARRLEAQADRPPCLPIT